MMPELFIGIMLICGEKESIRGEGLSCRKQKYKILIRRLIGN